MKLYFLLFIFKLQYLIKILLSFILEHMLWLNIERCRGFSSGFLFTYFKCLWTREQYHYPGITVNKILLGACLLSMVFATVLPTSVTGFSLWLLQMWHLSGLFHSFLLQGESHYICRPNWICFLSSACTLDFQWEQKDNLQFFKCMSCIVFRKYHPLAWHPKHQFTLI